MTGQNQSKTIPNIADLLAYSRIIFRFARSRMSSSIVPFVTKLPGLAQGCQNCDRRSPVDANVTLLTYSMCPCHSLQVILRVVVGLLKVSGSMRDVIILTSKMMTVSAVSRLIPKPPARVESRKAKSGEPGALKCSIDFLRTSDGMVPTRDQPGTKKTDIRTVEPLIDISTSGHVV